MELLLMRTCTSKTVLFLALMTVIHAASKETLQRRQLEESLDELIPTLISCRKLAGVSVAVVRGADTILVKGYGRADIGRKYNVTEQTLFGLASLSKAFTATLLGKIMASSKQRYTWNTRIRSILGKDFYLYDRVRTEQMTVKDMLVHRTGYPSYNNIRHQSALDRYKLLEKVRLFKPAIPFRSQFKYNNLMYGLLTYVTEVIGGDIWEDLVTKHIFRPLNMTSSTFTHRMDLNRRDLAKPYKVDYDGNLRQVSPEYHSYWGKIGGSGSVVSSAADMAKWLKALLNKGQAEDGSDVIPDRVIQDCYKPYQSIPLTSSDMAFMKPAAPVSFTHFSYGLAWRVGFYRGWRTVHHTGTSMGYLSQITLLPDLGFGVFTSLTGEDPGFTSRRHIHLHVLDLLLGERPWLNATTACTMPQGGKLRSDRVRNDNRIPSGSDLADYVGTYGNLVFGNITFRTNRSGSLVMSFGDLGRYDVRPTSGDVDLCEVGPIRRFDAVGTGHVWSWEFPDIVFRRSYGGATGPMDQVVIYSLEPTDPPVFRRHAPTAGMPPAPDYSCVGAVRAVAVKVTSRMTWLAVVVIGVLAAICPSLQNNPQTVSIDNIWIS